MNITFPDIEQLDRFKQRINYPAIVQHIIDEKRVLMDWPKALNKIDVTSTSAWKSYNLSSSILSKNHAKFSDFFENGKQNITIKIHVFTGLTNKEVIEEAILLTGYTSMYDINMEYLENGPGDFYLYLDHWREGTGDNNAICVYKNIIVEITTPEDGTDVRPVAKLLADLMSVSLIEKNEVPKITYKMLYSAQEVKTGETFWVDILFPSAKNPENYKINFQMDDLTKGLEHVKHEGSKYYLKASQAGSYQFEMWLMDKRTLITETVSFTVTVKN
ncbi:MAG: hypothetical protein QM500_15310 [Methylococcales bacterium]